MIEKTTPYQLVNQYEDLDKALFGISRDRVDLIIIGLESIYFDRIQVVQEIRKKAKQAEVIIICDYVNEQVLKAIKYGVMGFLLRISPLYEIEEAINLVLNGAGFFNSQVARKFVDSYYKNTSSPLTSREAEVLGKLAQGKTYTMIAGDLEISSGTVKTHLKNIYHKLHVSSKAEAIHMSRKIRLQS